MRAFVRCVAIDGCTVEGACVFTTGICRAWRVRAVNVSRRLVTNASMRSMVDSSLSTRSDSDSEAAGITTLDTSEGFISKTFSAF